MGGASDGGDDLCPFDTLPDNLFLEVFQYLAATDLIRIQRVCKKWRHLSSDFYLWRKIRIAPHPITKVTLSKLVNRYFTRATTSLDISGARRWRQMNKTASLSNHILTKISEKSPKLQEFKIDEDNLKEVDLHLLPRSIQRFSFTNCDIPVNCLVSSRGHFTSLKFLLFRRCPSLVAKHFVAFGKLTTVEKLECYGCYRFDHSTIETIAENFPNLRTLVLVGTPHLGNQDCSVIAEKLKKLEVMEIEEWCDITMEGVSILRKRLRNLKFLSIKCRSINEGKIIIQGSRVHT